MRVHILIYWISVWRLHTYWQLENLILLIPKSLRFWYVCVICEVNKHLVWVFSKFLCAQVLFWECLKDPSEINFCSKKDWKWRFNFVFPKVYFSEQNLSTQKKTSQSIHIRCRCNETGMRLTGNSNYLVDY